MAITVFLLICGPFAALLFVPLATRQQLRPAHVARAPKASEPTPASAKGLDAIRWSPIRWGIEADDDSRSWKNAA